MAVNLPFTDLEHHINPEQNAQLQVESINSIFVPVLSEHKLFSNQLVNPATSSPADDVHHYVIPPKVTIDQ
jgi:hypothetical protein